MRSRWWWIPCASLLLAQPTWADDTVDPYADELVKPLTWKEKQARQTLLKQAEEAVAKEAWREAEHALEKVPGLMTDAESLLWLGYALEKQGKLVKAKTLYQRAQSIAGRAKNIDLTNRATMAIDELRKRIPRLKVIIRGDLHATITLDEETVTMSPEGIEVDPGKHLVEVRAPERKPYRVGVVAIESGVHLVEASLPLIMPPAPPAPPPQPPQANGCAEGCSVPKGDPPGWAWPAIAVTAALIRLRRRRRAANKMFVG